MNSVHTMATQSRTKNRGADLMARLLRAQGVEHVMALTGGAIMESMDALEADEQLNMHIFQTEPGAAWAAMGYARATGKVGGGCRHLWTGRYQYHYRHCRCLSG